MMDTRQEKNGRRCFVIFAGPQQQGGPGIHYISKDGIPTAYRHEAAKFDTLQDAKDFLEHKHVALTATTYIGQEDFTEFEIC
ncbi:MAG: hypothetical protein ABI980_10540 [Nitrospirota bacterium]|jgi:hypothetical protein